MVNDEFRVGTHEERVRFVNEAARDLPQNDPKDVRLMRAMKEVRALDRTRIRGTVEDRVSRNQQAIEAIFRKHGLRAKDYGL